ncbi:acyltransferase family protein [Luteimonas sp. A501]
MDVNESPARALRAWRSITRTHPTAGQHLAVLDGLRGLALLLVLASHLGLVGAHLIPGLDFSGAGKTGVWLFFALSSFLLMQQLLALDAAGRLDARAWGRFAVRRVLRIYPLYVVYLLVCWLAPFPVYPRMDDTAELGRHLVAIEGTGHLWSIAVEVHFYLLLPVLVLAWRYLLRRRVAAALLAIAVVIAVRHLADPAFDRDGLHTYLAIFMAGSGAAVFHHHLRGRAWWRAPATRHALAVLACALTLLLVVITPGIWNLVTGSALLLNHWHHAFTPFALVSALLVLAAANAAPWLQSAFAILPLRVAGVVSFGAYLWHATLLANVRYSDWFAGTWQAWAFVAVTLAVSIASYLLLEEPFLRIGARKRSPSTPARPAARVQTAGRAPSG